MLYQTGKGKGPETMILIVQNDPKVPAGLYGRLLAAWGIPHGTWRAYDRSFPPDDVPPAGVILLGGYMGVHDGAAYPFLNSVKEAVRQWLARDLPFFGICLGGQLLADVLGSPVFSGRRGEQGCRSVELTEAGRRDPLFAGIPSPFPAFQWHNDSFEVPAAAAHLAFTPLCPGQAIRCGNAWGVQFHPEVDEAIVDAWRRKTGAGPEVVAEFRRQEPRLREVAEKMLRNFLGCCGLAAGAEGGISHRSGQ